MISEANKLPGLPSHKIALVLKLAEDGKTAKEISDQLRVQVSVIETFLPKTVAQPKAQRLVRRTPE